MARDRAGQRERWSDIRRSRMPAGVVGISRARGEVNGSALLGAEAFEALGADPEGCAMITWRCWQWNLVS